MLGDSRDTTYKAMAQCFFASLKCARIAPRSRQAWTNARLAIFAWIETRYDRRLRHSSLGQTSPINFEIEG